MKRKTEEQDEAKLGTDWQASELDAIVVDYFAMLEADLTGRPYVKLRHSQDLMAQIGRTHRSVEFKHQNISAVLDELGMPWIPGYRPKRNYQNAIFDAIDRYLTRHPAVLEAVPRSPTAISPPSAVFVDAPVPTTGSEPIPERLRHLVRKFDPVERDYRNRTLGKAGERFVVDLERRRLTEIDRADLAQKVRWVAAEDGDGAGYDILSFDDTDRPRLIEVKTTNGTARTPFYLSRNERGVRARRIAGEGVDAMSKRHMGSSIDDFLKEEGVFEEAQAEAVKEVVSWQLAQAMKERKISKKRMATLLRTSRTQVDRLLDARNDITLSSLQRAAAVVGRRVTIELV